MAEEGREAESDVVVCGGGAETSSSALPGTVRGALAASGAELVREGRRWWWNCLACSGLAAGAAEPCSGSGLELEGGVDVDVRGGGGAAGDGEALRGERLLDLVEHGGDFAAGVGDGFVGAGARVVEAAFLGGDGAGGAGGEPGVGGAGPAAQRAGFDGCFAGLGGVEEGEGEVAGGTGGGVQSPEGGGGVDGVEVDGVRGGFGGQALRGGGGTGGRGAARTLAGVVGGFEGGGAVGDPAQLVLGRCRTAGGRVRAFV